MREVVLLVADAVTNAAAENAYPVYPRKRPRARARPRARPRAHPRARPRPFESRQSRPRLRRCCWHVQEAEAEQARPWENLLASPSEARVEVFVVASEGPAVAFLAEHPRVSAATDLCRSSCRRATLPRRLRSRVRCSHRHRRRVLLRRRRSRCRSGRCHRTDRTTAARELYLDA